MSEVQEQYAAVREGGAGLIDLSSRARLIVSGSEAMPFLNGLVTNDVKALEEGRWMHAAFPNVQGRLLGAVRMLHRAGGFLIDMEASAHEAVAKTLSRFTLAGDFRLTEMTDELAAFTVQGARAAEIVGEVLAHDAAQVERGRIVEAVWKSESVSVIRATHTAEDGFDIFVNAADAEALWDALRLAGARPVGSEALEILRVEAGLPRFGVDVTENNVVLEAGLNEAVSFTKGCYLGQEIIARIHWRGHVAKRLAGLRLDEENAVENGAQIRSAEGKEIGRVTSTVFSIKLQKHIALAIVKYDYLAAGTEVVVVSGERELAGQVVELPFVRGSWYEASSASESV
jgi:folate-binding protein YgfZ